MDTTVIPLGHSAKLTEWRKSPPQGVHDRLVKSNCFSTSTSPTNGIPSADIVSRSSMPSSLIVLNGGNRISESSTCSTAPPTTTPSLVEPSASNSSTSSESVRTEMATSRLPPPVTLPDGDGIGNPPIPQATGPRARYQCLFRILECDRRFGDVGEWKTHVLSHFKTYPTPKDARCPCPTCSFTVNDHPGTAWQIMLDHISQAHLEQGVPFADTRTDFNLMRYLYCHGIIKDHQMRLVQLPAAPGTPGYNPSQDPVRVTMGSSDEPCCSHANPKRERRRGRPNNTIMGASKRTAVN